MCSLLAVMNLEQAYRNFYSVLAHDESDNFVRCAYLGAVPFPSSAVFILPGIIPRMREALTYPVYPTGGSGGTLRLEGRGAGGCSPGWQRWACLDMRFSIFFASC